MRNAVVAPIIAGLVAFIGCDQSAVTPHTTPTAIPTVAPSSTVTTAPTTAPRTSGSGRPVTILGVVRAGAPPGCDVLLAENGAHHLLLDTTDPPRNVPAEVTGVLDLSLISYCNTGPLLHVQRISRR
ncbi:MAG: hypothetical protein JO364_02460 [Pseudonocardiales bacterium]|nr:hypothetical protein [Pseudonocardiales bacterium]MBV9029173.1 hypothetical protein [Pseudonocardiales bacterium]